MAIAEKLLQDDVLDLEGVEYYTDDTDITMAKYQYAEVDSVQLLPDGVLVHFVEHTSLKVPYGYEFAELGH